MGGPSNTSSDILGIEVGRRVVRGVRLDQETTELTAAAEYPLDEHAVSVDGVIDPMAVGPALDQLIIRLGVEDRTQVRVGFTIGPRNAGVGSGPTMTSWLAAQALNLQEPMTCSGGLGISFVPTRAVDAALKLASGSGIELVRVDLAPVASARAIGDQVEDVICIGSGRGWQARMRDFEVLEAMENVEIGEDDPLSIVGPTGPPASIQRYGWVEVAPQLDRTQQLDIGQLAPAVGAAIGVAYESPANLLLGKDIGCGPSALKAPSRLGLNTADYELAPQVGEKTLQLGSTVSLDLDRGAHLPDGRPQQRELTVVPDPEPTPDYGFGFESTPEPEQIPDSETESDPEPLISALDPALGLDPAPVPDAALTSDAELAPGRVDTPDVEVEHPKHVRRIAPTRPGLSPLTAIEDRSGTAQKQSGADLWGDTVDESDPIVMFSPDTEVRHMMGKRDTRFNLDLVFVLLLLSAIALLLVYRYV